MSVEVYDNGGVGILWTTDPNWVSNSAPGAPDTAQLDATSIADSTADTPALAAVDMQAGYTGDVTQSVNMVIDTVFDIKGGVGSSWITAGKNLDIKGDAEASGAGLGLIHNAGGVVRFGAACILDEGDVDSPIEYFDFVGGPLVVHDTLILMGSTQIPASFIVRTNNQMRLVSQSSVMNLTLETGASITDDGTSRTLTFRGALTLVDTIGSILSTAPGVLVMAFNAINAPGADYGTANFQTTSTLIIIQGNVTNVNLALIYRTFTTTAGSLDLNGFNYSCVDMDIGNPANTTRNGDVTVRNGSVLTTTGFCSVNETDQVNESILLLESGGIGNIGTDLNVEAFAQLIAESTAVINLTGNFLMDALSPINLLAGSIVNLGGNLNIPDGTSIQSYDGTINAGIGGTSFAYSNPDNEHDLNLLTLASSCTMTITGNCYTDTLTGPTATPNATIAGSGQFLIDTYTNGENITVNGASAGSVAYTFDASILPAYDYGNAVIAQSTASLTVISGGVGTCSAHELEVFRSSQNITTLIDIDGAVACVFTQVHIGDTLNTRGGHLKWNSSATFVTFDFLIRTNDGVVSTIFEILAGAGDVTINNDFDVATLAELRFSNATSTIRVNGTTTISDTAVAAFGATGAATFKHAGDMDSGLEFKDLVTIVGGTTVNLLRALFIRNATWSFEGTGTFESNGFFIQALGDGTQLAGAQNVTFTGAGGITLNVVNVNGTTYFIPNACDFSAWQVGMTSSAGGARFIKLGGNFQADTFSITSDWLTTQLTLQLDGFTATFGGTNWGFSATTSGIIDLGVGGTLIMSNTVYTGSDNALIGTGTYITSGFNQNLSGSSIELSGITMTNTVNQVQVAGCTFDVGSGTVTLSGTCILFGAMDFGTGTYNMLGTNIDLSGTTSVTSDIGSLIKFSGTATQTAKLTSSLANTDVKVEKASNQLTFVDDFTLRNITATSLNTESQTIALDPAKTYTLRALMCLGSGDGLTTFVSTSPGTEWTLNVSRNSMCFHAAFTDCKVVGGIIEVDKATGGVSEGDLGGNTLSDGVTDGLLFKNVNLPTDLDIFMRRISAVTIDRRGEQVPTLKVSPLFTGDDWSLEVTVTDNGAVVDLATVTSIKAAVISDGNKALIPATTQDDSTVGADWGQGKVIVVFQASQTTLIDPAQNAWLELQIDDGVNVYTLPREQLQIIKGVIS